MNNEALRVSAVTLGFLVLLGGIAQAMEVSLYLLPRYRYKGGVMEIRDIAHIEVKGLDKEEVGSTAIDDMLYKDNYLDHKEILVMLREKYGNAVHVYGGGVAIVRDEPEYQKDNAAAAIAVKKGDKVRFSLQKGLVKVEVAGIAMDEGLEGEKIPVKLANDKIVHGRISAINRVEFGQ